MAAPLPWQPGAPSGATGMPAARPDADDAASPAPDAASPAPDAASPAPDAEEYRSLLDAAREVLDRVDRALGQLADGSYGRCRVCGVPIPDGVLASDPTAQRCEEHEAGPLGEHGATP